MKVTITKRQRNELLKRDEVLFRVDHQGSGTPSRLEIRKKLADLLSLEEERVYVSKFETKTGSMTAVGEAKAYDSLDLAKYAEPEHIVLRNSPKVEKKEQQA